MPDASPAEVVYTTVFGIELYRLVAGASNHLDLPLYFGTYLFYIG